MRRRASTRSKTTARKPSHSVTSAWEPAPLDTAAQDVGPVVLKSALGQRRCAPTNESCSVVRNAPKPDGGAWAALQVPVRHPGWRQVACWPFELKGPNAAAAFLISNKFTVIRRRGLLSWERAARAEGDELPVFRFVASEKIRVNAGTKRLAPRLELRGSKRPPVHPWLRRWFPNALRRRAGFRRMTCRFCGQRRPRRTPSALRSDCSFQHVLAR